MKDVPEHFFRQSAALPFRKVQGRLEILMVTSRRKKRWVIPKGVHEPDLDAAQSAAKEAFEEAGVEGDIAKEPLGTYQYEKWGGVCTVLVFPLAVHTSYDKWPECYRERQWLSPEEAATRAAEPVLKAMILAFGSSETEDLET